MIQYQHWCACVAISVSTYTKRNTLPSTLELETWSSCRLKCSCCSLATCRIHFFKKKRLNHRNHFAWAITAKRLRLPAIGRTSSAHTLVDHDSSHFSVFLPPSTAPNVFSGRVSHLSHCTDHLTRYSIRPTNGPH